MGSGNLHTTTSSFRQVICHPTSRYSWNRLSTWCKKAPVAEWGQAHICVGAAMDCGSCLFIVARNWKYAWLLPPSTRCRAWCAVVSPNIPICTIRGLSAGERLRTELCGARFHRGNRLDAGGILHQLFHRVTYGDKTETDSPPPDIHCRAPLHQGRPHQLNSSL